MMGEVKPTYFQLRGRCCPGPLHPLQVLFKRIILIIRSPFKLPGVCRSLPNKPFITLDYNLINEKVLEAEKHPLSYEFWLWLCCIPVFNVPQLPHFSTCAAGQACMHGITYYNRKVRLSCLFAQLMYRVAYAWMIILYFFQDRWRS